MEVGTFQRNCLQFERGPFEMYIYTKAFWEEPTGETHTDDKITSNCRLPIPWNQIIQMYAYNV